MSIPAFSYLDDLHAALELSPLGAAVLQRPAVETGPWIWLHCSTRLARLLDADTDRRGQAAALHFASTRSRTRLYALEKADHGGWGYEVVLAGGATRYLITMTGAQRIDYDGTDAVVAWFYDMAPRRELEDTVTHEQALLDCLINSIPDLIYYKGLDGCYLGSNSAFGAFAGRDDVRGCSDRELDIEQRFDTGGGRGHRDLDEQVLTSGVSLRQEEWWFDEDGRRSCLDVLRTPYVGPDGATLGMIGIGRDITQRKAQENELRAAKEAAESTERYKIEFLAKVSHELRTPLNAVMGLLQLLESTALDERQSDYRDRAHGAARVLQEIVQAILDYAKIEANIMRVEPAEFSLRDLAGSIIDVFGFDARRKGLDLRLEYDVTAPDMVRADPVILRSALSNLVSNAIKFTERGSVTLAIVRRGQDHAGHDLGFAVIDTGVGFDMARFEELFEPFVQGVNATTRTSAGGSGLGLAICRRLVRKMGGDLQCDSTPGAGTTFRFAIRVDKARTRRRGRGAAAELQAARERLQGRHILLVDDNALNRDIVAELLAQSGLRVDQAADGREAYSAVQARDYAAVLMDIQMPHMDGYQATRLIRTLVSAERLPVLAFTAHGMHEERQRCFESGMNAFVRKPVERDELLLTLAGAIAAGRDPHPPKRPSAGDATTAIDIDGFIAQMGGNAARGWQFLRRFHDEYTDIPQRLERLLARGDGATGWQLMHEFKSVCGIVRAGELARRTQALEAALRHGGDAAALLAAFGEEHSRVMQQIAHGDRLRV
jgi:signal transduction histidine kinase/CheY-like chemotaxis protein/HPt (histidine-containing phosphotransfer) domain-containing protein